MGKYGQGDLTWFKEARFGMFIHWGLYALGARHEWLRHNEEVATEYYQKYFDNFDPDMFNPKEWAAAAKAAGMRYCVITAKHHEGFCLWDTQYTDYKAPNTAAGRDLLREIVEAFRAEGLRVGLYYSLLDWHHPDFLIDSKYGPHRNLDAAARAEMNKGRDMARYALYMRNQVTELLTNYGKIDILWFDFSYPDSVHPENGELGKGALHWESEKLIQLVRKLQPEIIVDNRLDLEGSADIVTPEQFTPDGEMTDGLGRPVAWEGCQTFSGSWGYFRDEKSWKTADQCIELLVNHVSRNGNLLMNVGPTARGYFDRRALARLEDFGEWMHYNQRAIRGCGQVPDLQKYPAPADCRYTYNPRTKRLYVHMFSLPFNHLTLENLGDKIAYAQVLADGSEICYRVQEGTTARKNPNSNGPDIPAGGTVTLHIPNGYQPITRVPVIELMLKETL